MLIHRIRPLIPWDATRIGQESANQGIAIVLMNRHLIGPTSNRQELCQICAPTPTQTLFFRPNQELVDV